MDSMLGENKNLKDMHLTPPTAPLSISNGEGLGVRAVSYNKTNKLITALYMVTDTMEKEEPMRLKLRTLGIEILSDINLSKTVFDIEKITAILSFLNIASDIRMISEMNCNILRKEFTELKESIQQFTIQNNLWFEEFLTKSPLLDEEGAGGGNSKFVKHPMFDKKMSFNKGHPTRIGVQKGSTLMDALNKVGGGNDFGILKSKRREEIIAIIKNKKNTSGIDGASITDIKNGAKGTLVSCGEKTLQRELISMVKDNVLKKTGAKRWSLYSLN
jgi:hypothetical protein